MNEPVPRLEACFNAELYGAGALMRVVARLNAVNADVAELHLIGRRICVHLLGERNLRCALSVVDRNVDAQVSPGCTCRTPQATDSDC